MPAQDNIQSIHYNYIKYELDIDYITLCRKFFEFLSKVVNCYNWITHRYLFYLHNTTFLARDARRGLDEMHDHFGFADILLVDPPRCGAGGRVMRRIGRSQPKRIVYVSCCPDTFATDIAELLPFGYTLKTVQPVDLFPHTVHVECVALLELEMKPYNKIF